MAIGGRTCRCPGSAERLQRGVGRPYSLWEYAMDRQGYFERLQRLERELIPRPLEFVLAKKRENAVNPSVSSYAVQASMTSGGGSDATDDSGADDLGFPLHKEPICPYSLVTFNSQWSKDLKVGWRPVQFGKYLFFE